MSGMNVLLLQDNDEIREKLSFWLLGRFQANVLEVSAVHDAEVALSKDDPKVQLVIYDFQQSPVKAFRDFRNRFPEVPIVWCLTGATSDVHKGSGGDSSIRIVNRSTLMQDLEGA